MLPLITICVVFGAICGAIAWLVSSLTVGIIVGIIASFLAFGGFIAYGVISYNQPTDENAVERMTDWLNSPMEYGAKPASCEVIFHEELPWPMDGDTEHVILCKYRYEADEDDEEIEAIGLAWPTCWSFVDLDIDKFSIEDLVSCYRGWYTVFYGRHDQSLDVDSLSDEECEEVRLHLVKHGFEVDEPFTGTASQVARTQSGDTLFSVQVEKEGTPVIAVGNLADPECVETRDAELYGYAVAHYHWVDTWWQRNLKS